MLQPLSIEQGETGGGRTGGHNTFTRARDRVEFSFETVRTSYSLRPRQRRKELSDVAVAARWVGDVYPASHGSLLSSQRSRIYFVLVRTSLKVKPL